MTANSPITGFSDTWVTPLVRRWRVIVGLGVVVAALGVVLLLNPFAAARTLAVLVAVGLVVVGVDELAQAERNRARWPSYALAAIWFVTAVVALVWPGITLWVVAITVGIGLVVGGVTELALVARYHRDLPQWGLYLLDGLVSIVVGVLAVVWPDATILVLAIILGLRVLFRGVATVTFGLSLRGMHKMTSPHVPT